MHSSIVLGMTIFADCKVCESVTVHPKVYIWYIYIYLYMQCKWHTPYIIVYVQVWHTGVDLWKRCKHRALNKIWYKKDVLNKS